MTFSEALNQYMEGLDCTAQNLSAVSGISMSTISRYRNGLRIPEPCVLCRLSNGIAEIAENKGIKGISHENVTETLSAALSGRTTDCIDYNTLSARLNMLVKALDINITNMSIYCNLDKSFISRICSGQRKPREPRWIIQMAARYVVKTYPGQSDVRKVLELIGKKDGCFENNIDYREELVAWLSDQNTTDEKAIANVLSNIDTFNIDEFLRARSFGTVKTPTMSFQFPSTKTYYGVQGMEKGLIEFLKVTLLSNSCRDLMLFSDHPMDYCSRESDFPQKWMRGVAALLLKGLHINIIHNIDRPLKEMMLGFEAWIPLYMTGQISGYYFDNAGNNLHHLLLVSGSAAITGDAITECPESGRYTLYKSNTEVSRCRVRAEQLLQRAGKLTEIYDEDRAADFEEWIRKELDSHTECKRFLTSPPIFTLSDKLLDQILVHNAISDSAEEKVRNYIKKSRQYIRQVLQNTTLEENLAIWTQEEFESYPVALSLVYLFGKKDVFYSYEEYLEHIRQTKAFAAGNPHYRLTLDREPDFRNIQIAVRKGEYALISKNKSPAIHLLVRHPKIVHTINKLIMVLNDRSKVKLL